VCLYQGVDAQALRDHAAHLGIAADEITPVIGRIVFRADGELALAGQELRQALRHWSEGGRRVREAETRLRLAECSAIRTSPVTSSGCIRSSRALPRLCRPIVRGWTNCARL